MNLNIENVVRSAVVLVVGLPLALSLGNLTNQTSEAISRASSDPTATAADALKQELAGPCLRYMLSKKDSKLEREAKNDIDEVMGGAVNYSETCKWIF